MTDLLPTVQIEESPDPYDLSNHHFNQEFRYEARQPLRLIFDQRDFALADAHAKVRQGFYVADGSRLEYLENGKIRLVLRQGRRAS